jgi:hypothetical protein
MASAGPRYPGTVTTETGPSGDNDWTNASNVGIDDTAEATIVAPTYDANDHSYRLIASNFGFDAEVPAGATIDGITVEIERRAFAGAAEDQEVQLYDSTATLVGDDKQAATAWPGTSAIATYGGVADTWTAGLDAADIRSASFGVALIVLATAANTDIGVSRLRVTVAYTAVENHDGSFALTGGGAVGETGGKGGQSGLALTGGGVTVESADTARSVGVPITGGGVVTGSATHGRQIGLGLTGGGVTTVAGERDEAGEEHSGSFALTGGGAITTPASTTRSVGIAATGGGAAAAGQTSERSTGVPLTGGGVAVIGPSSERNAAVALTGGGAASVSAESARLGAALLSGGGVLTVGQATGRDGAFALTGGGVVTAQGSTAEDHTGSFAVTGGGAVATGALAQRMLALALTGGGAVAVASDTARSASLAFTGAGAIAAAWTGGHVGSPAVTGGGVVHVGTMGLGPRLPDGLAAVVTPVGALVTVVEADRLIGRIVPAGLAGSIEE